MIPAKGKRYHHANPPLPRNTMKKTIFAGNQEDLPTTNDTTQRMKDYQSLDQIFSQDNNKFSKQYLFTVQVPVDSVSNIMLTMWESFHRTKNPHVFSALSFPSEPGTLVFEAHSAESIAELFSGNPEVRITIDRILKVDNADLFTYFCIPSRLACIPAGKIIRLVDSMYYLDPAQVIYTNPQDGSVIVKLYPHIDYAELKKQNIKSQKVLNLKSESKKVIKAVPFDRNQLTSDSIRRSPLTLPNTKSRTIDMVEFDGNQYYGKFLYITLPLSSIRVSNIILTPEEFDRFSRLDSIAFFEEEIPGFQDHMKSTKVEKEVLKERTRKTQNKSNGKEIESSSLINHRNDSVVEIPKFDVEPKPEANVQSHLFPSRSTVEEVKKPVMKAKQVTNTEFEVHSEVKTKEVDPNLLQEGSVVQFKDGKNEGLKCSVVKIGETNAVGLTPVSQKIVGSRDAFRRPCEDEFKAIMNCNTRKKKLDTLAPAQVVHTYNTKGIQSDPFLVYRNRFQENAKKHIKPVYNVSEAQTDPIPVETKIIPTYREGDILKTNSKELGMVINADPPQYIMMLLDGTKKSIDENDVYGLIQNDCTGRDSTGKEIYRYDCVRIKDNEIIYKIIHTVKGKAFLRDDNHEYRVVPLIDITVQRSEFGAHNSIIGQTIVRVEPDGKTFSDPMHVLELTNAGYIYAGDEKHPQKFKFSDHQKKWAFEKEKELIIEEKNKKIMEKQNKRKEIQSNEAPHWEKPHPEPHRSHYYHTSSPQKQPTSPPPKYQAPPPQQYQAPPPQYQPQQKYPQGYSQFQPPPYSQLPPPPPYQMNQQSQYLPPPPHNIPPPHPPPPQYQQQQQQQQKAQPAQRTAPKIQPFR